MTAAFDQDTAVALDGRGRYGAVITDRWSVGDQPNGGYLLAIVGRALAQALPHPDPRTLTGHYLRPPAPGPSVVEVDVVRAGRGASTGEGRLLRDDVEVLRVIGTYADLAAARGQTLIDGAPPELPPPDDCDRVLPITPTGKRLALAEQVDMRVPPGTPGWAHGSPTGRPVISGWLRSADGREPDPLFLLLAVDAFAPPVLELSAQAWVPTVELTVHVWGRPAPGWLRLRARTRYLIDGWLEEEAEVWDADDRLVVRARQLALLAHPHVR